jgi:hypothetical protein
MAMPRSFKTPTNLGNSIKRKNQSGAKTETAGTWSRLFMLTANFLS